MTHTRHIGYVTINIQYIGDGDYKTNLYISKGSPIVEWTGVIHSSGASTDDPNDDDVIDNLAVTAIITASHELSKREADRLHTATEGARKYGGYRVVRVNPEGIMKKRLARRSTGGQHTRYIGDAVVRLEHYGSGQYEAEISLLRSQKDIEWEEAIKAHPQGDPDSADFIDRLAVTAVGLAIAEGPPRVSSMVDDATAWAVDGHGGYEVQRGNPRGTRGNPDSDDLARASVSRPPSLSPRDGSARALSSNPARNPARKIATVKGLQTVHVYRLPEFDEYLVRYEGARVGEGYHTDDKADAMGTATAMSKRSVR